MPALDLALGLGMVGGATDVIHPLLVQRLNVALLARRPRRGRRPDAALNRRQADDRIVVENRPALDDSARRRALPAPLQDLNSAKMMTPTPGHCTARPNEYGLPNGYTDFQLPTSWGLSGICRNLLR